MASTLISILNASLTSRYRGRNPRLDRKGLDEFFGATFPRFLGPIWSSFFGGISRIDSHGGATRRFVDLFRICSTRPGSTRPTPTPSPRILFFTRSMSRFDRNWGYGTIHRFTGRAHFIAFFITG